MKITYLPILSLVLPPEEKGASLVWEETLPGAFFLLVWWEAGVALESRVGPGHGSCCWAQESGSRHCWTTLRPREHEAWTGHGLQEIPFRDVKSSGEQVVSGKEGAELRSEHQAEARGSCRAGGRSSVAGRGVGRGRGPQGRRLLLCGHLLCGHGTSVWFSREKKGWLRMRCGYRAMLSVRRW